MVRAVLDANVYVSALVRPEGPPGQIVRRFLRDAAFEIVLCQAIVDEVLRAFTYPKVRKHIRRSVDPALWFEDIVVLAALEGRAALLVSGDPDLLAIKDHEGVRIVSPRAFLDLLAA